VTVSRPLGEELANLGVPRDRIHLVPNGVDTTLFHPRDRDEARRTLGLPLDRPIILFVGRLEPQKGLGELLDAFAAIRAKMPGAMLALVGNGVWRDRVEAKKKEWGDDLVAPGARPLSEVATWMAACNVFTLPSWNEGTPNVVLEALASGRPAVGSDVGGIPDVLSDPRSGLVVPAKNATALADGLLEALSREWPVNDVRACGPGSWGDSASQLHEVLESARKTSPRPSP
jgi:glycosyltransferase involved in cell wall biosynthesis